MKQTIIKFKESQQSRSFATRNNLDLGKWFKVSYQDGDHFFVDDGGVIQEIPTHLVETKRVDPSPQQQRRNILLG